MPLRLVVGPANAGKVALLLERYLQELARSPVLVVPTRPDVEWVERDLLARVPAILGGSIGTFDDLFERVADTDPERPLVRLRGLARHRSRRARVGVARPCVGRRGPRPSLRGVPLGARAAGFLGSGPPARTRRRPAPDRSRGLARRARVRLRLRGPDRIGMGTARGARRANGGHGLAPVRAGPDRIRLAPGNGRGSGTARR